MARGAAADGSEAHRQRYHRPPQLLKTASQTPFTDEMYLCDYFCRKRKLLFPFTSFSPVLHFCLNVLLCSLVFDIVFGYLVNYFGLDLPKRHLYLAGFLYV